MKILHTADWHLGKRLDTIERINEQKVVMDEICTIADKENVDLVLIAGDLFDNANPSTEAIELYFKTLKRLTKNGQRPVVAIAGNHDSPDRIETPDPLARECGIFLSGYPGTKIELSDHSPNFQITKNAPGFIEIKILKHDKPVRLFLTPYANELRLKALFDSDNKEDALRSHLKNHWQSLADTYADAQGYNILMAHLYVGTDPSAPKEEEEGENTILHIGGAPPIYLSDIPEAFDYTALGHLHRQHQVGKTKNPVMYSGSPLAYSFSEAHQEKYVMLIDTETKGVSRVKLETCKKLTRVKYESVIEALEYLKAHQNEIIELTLVSDTYLIADDRKAILTAHENVFIIPQTKSGSDNDKEEVKIDLSKSMEELFAEYFKFKNNGQNPDEELLTIFNEIVKS